MTTSEITKEEPWDRLASLATSVEGTRSDIRILLRCRESFDTFSPVYLFWELYRPSMIHDDGSRTRAPKLPTQAKSLVLQLLEKLHQLYRVQYEPDHIDSSFKKYLQVEDNYNSWKIERVVPPGLEKLIIFIHIAAARAFVLMQDSGLSEEAVACLEDVERSWLLLRFNGYPGSSSGYVVDYYESFHSVDTISALTLLELAHISRRRGDYAEALHRMAESEERYSGGAFFAMGPEDRWPLDSDETSMNQIESIWLSEFLTGMQVPIKYVLETFELLRHSGSDVDWSQVVDDCKRLISAYSLCFPTNPDDIEEDWLGYRDYMLAAEEQMERELVAVEEGERVTWSMFWYGAQKWAQDQLSPSEYRKMRDQDEKDAAEKRLRNYFFGSSWASLPERAQEALITADSNWHSPQKIRQASILNELLRASEEMCHNFIWEMLENNDEASKHLIAIEHTIVDHGRSEPNIRDYIRACKQTSFRRFLCRSKVNKGDIRFMTEDLPKSMTRLTDARNDAEHESGVSVSRDRVASFFNRFLGIGQPGILPELARIGRKLQISTD